MGPKVRATKCSLWGKIKSPIQSAAKEWWEGPNSGPKGGKTRATEGPITKGRQDELKAAFQKRWNKKLGKDQKYKAGLYMELEKDARNNIELQYLRRLEDAATQE